MHAGIVIRVDAGAVPAIDHVVDHPQDPAATEYAQPPAVVVILMPGIPLFRPGSEIVDHAPVHVLVVGRAADRKAHVRAVDADVDQLSAECAEPERVAELAIVGALGGFPDLETPVPRVGAADVPSAADHHAFPGHGPHDDGLFRRAGEHGLEVVLRLDRELGFLRFLLLLAPGFLVHELVKHVVQPGVAQVEIVGGCSLHFRADLLRRLLLLADGHLVLVFRRLVDAPEKPQHIARPGLLFPVERRLQVERVVPRPGRLFLAVRGRKILHAGAVTELSRGFFQPPLPHCRRRLEHRSFGAGTRELHPARAGLHLDRGDRTGGFGMGEQFQFHAYGFGPVRRTREGPHEDHRRVVVRAVADRDRRGGRHDTHATDVHRRRTLSLVEPVRRRKRRNAGPGLRPGPEIGAG